MAVSINGNGTVTGLTTIDSVQITGITSLTTTDLTADTSTLHVDSANNRVGIGTITPSVTCDVNGTINATLVQQGGTAVLVATDIGSTVQAYDADLTALGGLAKTDGNFIVGNGTTWVAESGATARSSLGLGSAATSNTGDFATAAQGTLADSAVQPGDNISTLTNNSGFITGNQTITLSGDVSGSGTTAITVTVADDSHNHIISNVDGLQTALDAKAPIANPTFTGTATTPNLQITNAGLFRDITGNYGSIEVDGGSTGGYEGYSIGGRAVFMHNNSTTTGIYNDVNNHWIMRGVHGGLTSLYYNGSEKLQTTSGGVSVTGTCTATSFSGDGSGLTGVSSTNVISGEVVFFSNSQINGGTTYVNGPFSDFRYATGMRVSGSHTKLSATSDIIMMSTYCCRNTSGNFHAMAVWCDAGNTTSLFRNTPFDPYHMQQNRPTFTTVATFSGLSAGSHTYNVCAGRGDTSSGTGTVNYNPHTTYGPLINTNSYTSIVILEVEP